jgi:uncharacterized protein YciI
MEFDTFAVVFLILNPNLPDDDPGQDRIQIAHQAYLGHLRKIGKVIAAGPTGGQPMRGIVLFNSEVEEAKELMSDDPAVRAGWFTLETTPWFVPKGEITY